MPLFCPSLCSLGCASRGSEAAELAGGDLQVERLGGAGDGDPWEAMLLGDSPQVGTRDRSVRGRCLQRDRHVARHLLESLQQALPAEGLVPEQPELAAGDANAEAIHLGPDLCRRRLRLGCEPKSEGAGELAVPEPILQLAFQVRHSDHHPRAYPTRRYNETGGESDCRFGYSLPRSRPTATAVKNGGTMLVWLGFALSIALLLLISRRSLAVGMSVATVVLAAFTLTPGGFGGALLLTITDPSVVLLAFVVGIIPMIGGTMEASGEMERLVSNLRIGLRPFLAISPALLGLLPMPGGTLLSAPLIELGAGKTPQDVKAAANVWFRHVPLLIYPLGPGLIASAKVAGLEVYDLIPYLLPAFVIAIVIGYVFLLRRASGRLESRGPFSLVGLVVPLTIILVAPLLDLLLKRTVDLPVAELGTSVGVLVSLGLAILVGRTRIGELRRVFVRMRPWKYSFIVLAMFSFLNVFTVSGLPERVAAMALPPVVLCVVIGAILGLIAGRLQAPLSIIIPIYVSSYGAMTLPVFAVTYASVFLGYLLTPIHPCVSVSVEYFRTTMGPYLRRMAVPIGIGWVAALVAGFLVL